jgi:choline-glycine betaine transporter
MSMLRSCLDRRVIAVLALAALAVAILAPRALGAALPLLLVAACPISMVAMMVIMSRTATAPGRSQGVESRRAELAALAQRQRHLERELAEETAVDPIERGVQPDAPGGPA